MKSELKEEALRTVGFLLFGTVTIPLGVAYLIAEAGLECVEAHLKTKNQRKTRG